MKQFKISGELRDMAVEILGMIKGPVNFEITLKGLVSMLKELEEIKEEEIAKVEEKVEEKK